MQGKDYQENMQIAGGVSTWPSQGNHTQTHICLPCNFKIKGTFMSTEGCLQNAIIYFKALTTV